MPREFRKDKKWEAYQMLTVLIAGLIFFPWYISREHKKASVWSLGVRNEFGYDNEPWNPEDKPARDGSYRYHLQMAKQGRLTNFLRKLLAIEKTTYSPPIQRSRQGSSVFLNKLQIDKLKKKFRKNTMW